MTGKQGKAATLVAMMAMAATGVVQADEAPKANFTGTLLTAGAAPYTPGHFYLQPYLVHTHTSGSYDDRGNRSALDDNARDDRLSLLIGYGFSERLTGQLTLNGGRSSSAGQHSDGLRFGDSSAKLVYALRQPEPGTGGMIISGQVSQSFATGKHDRLGENERNGIGNGSHRTDIALLGQQSFLLSNGHVLRWRWQAGWSPSPSRVDVEGRSVYGTEPDFRGKVELSRRNSGSMGFEYSLTPQWALALDLSATWLSADVLQGCYPVQGGQCETQREVGGSARSFSAAPALEYIPNDRVGILLGAEVSLPGGRNSSSFVSPQLSMVLSF